jgi:ABC-2 type transport system permease protein
MRAWWGLSVALARSTLREPVGFFFAVVFAPTLVLVLGTIFGNRPSEQSGGLGYLSATLPAFASVVLAIVGVMLLPVSQLQLRETGALVRLRVTPLRPRVFLAADLSVHFAIGMVGIVLAFAAGALVFGVALPDDLARVLAACALGLVAFLALGCTLAAVYPTSGAATGIGNILMILLMMTSGAFVPVEVMPDSVQQVVQFSPVRQFVHLVRGLWFGDPWSQHLGSTAVLCAMVVVFGAFGTWKFRWRPQGSR